MQQLVVQLYTGGATSVLQQYCPAAAAASDVVAVSSMQAVRNLCCQMYYNKLFYVAASSVCAVSRLTDSSAAVGSHGRDSSVAKTMFRSSCSNVWRDVA
jgi:hypothetical protein